MEYLDDNNEQLIFFSLEELLKNKKISLNTFNHVKMAKSYIEKKYDMKFKKSIQKNIEFEQIKSYINQSSLNFTEKNEIINDLYKKKNELIRKSRKKINIFQFIPLKIIGKGAFGEVRVVRHAETNKIYALKKMQKEQMKIKNQLQHIQNERDILSLSYNNIWITQLYYSFQDEKYLYIVMDFLQGGDLMNLLIKKDILTENEAKFYIAEIILSVDSIHQLGCIHRDLKPDNILIDKRGHIKLSDFGLSIISKERLFPLTAGGNNNINNNVNNINNNVNTHSNTKSNNALLSKSFNPQQKNQTISPGKNNVSNMIYTKSIIPTTAKDISNANTSSHTPSTSNITKRPNRLMAFSKVGTPNYIAPEVFANNGYGPEIDWWSVGIMLYEMLVGYPPFYCESQKDTFEQIKHFQSHFRIPRDAHLSQDASDLIRKFITVPENRLGVNGVEEIKCHPFFNGIDWDNIQSMIPPFIPKLDNDYDTRYFQFYPENPNEPFYYNGGKDGEGGGGGNKNKCFGFTYNRDIVDDENESGKLINFVKMKVEEKIKNRKNNLNDLTYDNNTYKLNHTIYKNKRIGNVFKKNNNLNLSNNSNINNKNVSSKSPDCFQLKRSALNNNKVGNSKIRMINITPDNHIRHNHKNIININLDLNDNYFHNNNERCNTSDKGDKEDKNDKSAYNQTITGNGTGTNYFRAIHNKIKPNEQIKISNKVILLRKNKK